MKFKGRSIKNDSHEYVVIPKGGIDIVFKAKTVNDMSAFDKLMEKPQPPFISRPNMPTTYAYNDPGYLALMEVYNEARAAWLHMTSLADSEITFETVNPGDPTTFKNMYTELSDAGFSNLEINNILQAVNRACGLDQEKIDRATEDFLAGLVQEQNVE